MSHFTLIKTKFKSGEHLIDALKDLGHDVQENQELVITNPDHREDHPVIMAELAISNDVGFVWNEETKVYDLNYDHATWDLNIPVERFIQKLQQQYALRSITSSVKEDGFEIEMQAVAEDGAVELVCTRWTN